MRFSLPALGLVLLSGSFAIAGDSPDQKDRVVVKSVIASGGRLGVHITDLTPSLRKHFGSSEDAGVLVGEVEADSPAAKAGLRVGDLVVSVDGDKVTTAFDVLSATSDRKKGDTVAIEILRDRKRLTLSAKVDARTAAVFPRGDDFDFDFDFDFQVPDIDGHGARPRVKVFRYPDADDDDKKVIERLEKLERRLEKLEQSTR